MTLPAVDMALSATSPLPEGAMAPPSADGGPEPAPPAETLAAKSSASEATPAKPPAASLISIAAKGRSGGPAKAGDLTRLFELARRQAAVAPATPSEPPLTAPVQGAEPEVAPPSPTEASSPLETPVIEPPPVETPVAPAPLETAAAGELERVTPSTEPMIVPEATIEPGFPLMLAPPSGVTGADAAMLVDAERDSMPTAETDVIAVPDWVKAISRVEETLPLETTEPLKVALSPMEETPPSAPSAVTEPAPAALVPAKPAAAPIPPASRAPVFKELVDYWRSLRHGGDHPTAESIDRDLVTERWPGALLMTYLPASQDPRDELRPSRVTRLGTACAEAQSAAEVGSQSTDWMLEAARTALVNDEPVEEQQRLETLTGVAGFRMVALPLGPAKGLPSAVLCILTPSPGAPRFGKRRIWL